MSGQEAFPALPAPPAPAPPAPALPAPAPPSVATVGKFQRSALRFFMLAKTAEQKAALEQQREQQLATGLASLQQSRGERVEQEAEAPSRRQGGPGGLAN